MNYRNKIYSKAQKGKSAFTVSCFCISAMIFSSLPFYALMQRDSNTVEDVPISYVEKVEETQAEIYYMSEADIEAAARRYIEEHSPKYVFPLDGYMTSAFSSRTDPILGDREEFHTGIDIAPNGDIYIRAYSDGVVKKTVVSNVGYGIHTIIEHEEGFETLYAHCSELLVEQGQDVKAGDIIAIVGNTGRSTGTHLHFEVRIDGKAVDPSAHMKENGAKVYA